jgi:phosphatidylserine/phosphatidylglycerophosphate/cardiolipin synthase-like enzyme
MKFKRDVIYLIVIVVLLGLVGQFWYSYQYQPKQARKIDVYYNQERELNKDLVNIIRDADQYVYFAVYTFTRFDLKDALLAAKYRGVNVIGVMDREQNQKIDTQKKIYQELKEAGIPIYEQDHTSIMHLKALVTEKAYASGSYNWTAAATNLNDEVLEIGRDEEIRKKYEAVLLELFRRYGE